MASLNWSLRSEDQEFFEAVIKNIGIELLRNKLGQFKIDRLTLRSMIPCDPIATPTIEWGFCVRDREYIMQSLCIPGHNSIEMRAILAGKIVASAVSACRQLAHEDIDAITGIMEYAEMSTFDDKWWPTYQEVIEILKYVDNDVPIRSEHASSTITDV